MSSVVWEYNNISYVLTEAQADAVDVYSAGEPDDAAFNKWFLKYAKDNNVRTQTHGRAKWWSRVPDSKDNISRLVSVKQSAHTLMKVVDPTIKIEEIKFDDDGAYSIPSEPATKAASLHEALDNTAGFTIHSAFKQSFSGYKPNEFVHERARLLRQDNGKHHILDALVTMRSNYQGLLENPGFSDYIDSASEYVYNGYKLPEEWPSKEPGNQIGALMAPSMYGSRVGDVKSTPYADKIEQSNQIINDVLTAKEIRSIGYLKAVDKIYSLIDVPDKDDEKDTNSPVPMTLTGDENFDKAIDEATSERVDARVEMEEEYLENFGGDASRDKLEPVNLIKVRPKMTDHLIKSDRMSGSIVKADAHLRLKKTLDKRVERFQKSGDLDEDELHRLYLGDDRVFMNVEEEQEESASIHFLIDASGSMLAGMWGGGPDSTRLGVAVQLSWLFAHSMNKRTHVKSHVWAHTGDIYGEISHRGPVVYDIWKSGEPINRLDLTLAIPTVQNYDGYAIEYVGNMLHKEDALKKYLIVLSDGQPAAETYGGRPAIRHVRRVTDAQAKRGIHVVQIAIGGGIEGQAEMFKHFLIYRNVDTMIREFAKILDKAR